MAKQRYIDTKFWDDNYITKKDPIEKLLFIYFLTNPLTNILGIYEISLRRAAFDTGIEEDMISKILQRFEKDNKIKYSNGFIAIKNFTKHQKNNPKINKGIEILLKETPEELITWVNIDYDRLSIDHIYPLNYSNSNININPNNNSNNNSNKESPEYKLSELLLNKIKENNPNYREPNLSIWTTHIDKMIRIDKRDPTKIKKVIEWCQADPFWYKNILSPEKLRMQYDQLFMNMESKSFNKSKNLERANELKPKTI